MNKEIKKIVEETKNIDGWLSIHEGEFLYKTAKNCTGKGVIVEIGSWKGKSTIWLAKGSQAGHHIPVYAIDPHIGAPEHHIIINPNIWTFDEFKKNIQQAGVIEIVKPIVNRSENVARTWNQPIEFLWVDGAHAYQSAKLDFDSWYPHVIDGGIIAYHDNFGEVKTVVKEKIFLSLFFRECGLVDSIGFGTKQINRIGKITQLRNRFVLLLSDLKDFSRNLHLPKPFRQLLKKIGNGLINKKL